MKFNFFFRSRREMEATIPAPPKPLGKKNKKLGWGKRGVAKGLFFKKKLVKKNPNFNAKKN